MDYRREALGGASEVMGRLVKEEAFPRRRAGKEVL